MMNDKIHARAGEFDAGALHAFVRADGRRASFRVSSGVKSYKEVCHAIYSRF
jgi:hypothetical protein